MPKKDMIELNGRVTEALPNTMFRIETDEGKVIATLKGKLRRSWVRIFPGDMVRIEVSVYDKTRGRIILKHKKF